MGTVSLQAPSEEPIEGRVVAVFDPPRYVIEVWRNWRSQWLPIEHGHELEKAEKRAALISKREDAPTRIVDRRLP